MNTFFGIKKSQTHSFDKDGNRVPLTWVTVEPMVVFGSKTTEKEGYNSLRVAFGTKKSQTKPVTEQLKSLSEKFSPKYTKEIKVEVVDKNPGDKILISDIFAEGDIVNVTGMSKGKGFASAIKLHGFKGGPKTHGASDRTRAPGSIGSGTTPGRVYKGKRMAAHMGNNRVTIENLSIFQVKPEENLVAIKGLIPGNVGGLVTIYKA